MISQRRQRPELMDQPGLDERQHVAALRGLQRLNTICRSAAIVWPSIAEAARQIHPTPLRVLDLACGGGDNMLAIAQHARRESLQIEISGCDISPTAVAQSRHLATSNGFASLDFFQLDVFAQPIPLGFHVITCSLFLHHLAADAAARLLRLMAEATQDIILVSDLRRTWRGLGLAWAGSRLLTRSPIVHVDAVRSVTAAFAADEIAQLAMQSELDGCVITHHWPQRWLLWWRKS